MPTFQNIGGSLLEQLYKIVSGGDNVAPPSPNNFISWCSPGIPFDPSEFDFCIKGLGGGATAEEERTLAQQAYNFAALADFVPEAPKQNADSKIKTDQIVFRTPQHRLSHIYQQILQQSRVASQQLTDKELEKLEKFRKLLMVTKTVTDIVTDEETQVTELSPMQLAFNQEFAAYTTAKLTYNMKRIAAATATGANREPVIDFQRNGMLYRQQLKAAEDAWVSRGYRREVDKINAYINNLGLRDLQVWKKALLDHFEDAMVSSTVGPFPYTTLIPGNFARSAGWNKFEFLDQHIQSKTRYETNSWGGSAGASFGLFSIGGSVGGSSESNSSDTQVSSFSMGFELAQVVISRPWFYPEFFASRGWMLDPGAGWTFEDMPSDGNLPPKGIFVAYPTMVLFARNIWIDSSDFASHYDSQRSQIGGGGSIGFGPFNIGGSYQKSEGSTNVSVDRNGSKLSVNGMQAIGFINRLTGKAPNPDPNIPVANFE